MTESLEIDNMQGTFRAAVLTGLNAPLELLDLVHKEPVDYQVKIKMITTGLCGAQVNEITGKKGDDKYLPHLMGHEGYGEVTHVGPSVSKVKPGDHVIVHWRESEGGGIAGLKYKTVDDEDIGAGPCTTFAEYTIVGENRCTKVPECEDLKHVLPLLGCAVSTAYGAVTKEAKVTEDDAILVFGAGGLGMAIIFWCKVLGFSNVDVVDIHNAKRDQVEDFGGKFIPLDALTDDASYDKIFETTGVVANIEKSLAVANKRANVILIGQPPTGASVKFENFLKYYDDIALKPSMGGHFEPDIDMLYIYNTCIKNSQLAKKLISSCISLDEINQGFLTMKSSTSRRIVIDFSGKSGDEK